MTTLPILGLLSVLMVIAPLRSQSTSTKAPTGNQQSPPSAQTAALIRTKEAALKDALFQMRKAIDRYFADKKQYPKGLDSLTSAKYLNRIPTDPFTESKRSWRVVRSQPDPSRPTVAVGMYDVKSGFTGTALDGTKYLDW